MFYANASTRQFQDWQLDQLLGTGLAEMIIQSGEAADAPTADAQLQQVIGYIRAHPSTLFVFELGNEPDLYDQPIAQARVKRLTTIRDIKPKYAGDTNLLWAINMNSQGITVAEFNALVADASDGLGNLLAGPYRPDIVTVHCYGYDTLCRSDGNAPYKMIDWVRGWNGGINIKVTEAGIGSTPGDRPNRYVEFAEKASASGGGNLDSVCFYGLPDSGPLYSIDAAAANVIGSRAAANYCG